MPPTALPTRMVEIASGIGHDCFWMMLFTTRQMANKLTRSKTSMASKRKSLKGSGVGVGIEIRSRFFGGVSFRMTFLKPWEICNEWTDLIQPKGHHQWKRNKKKHSQIVAVSKHIDRPTINGFMMGDLRTFFRGYSRLPGGFVVRTLTETVCKYAPMSRSNGAAYGTASVINTTNYKSCWIHPTCTLPQIKNWSLRTSVHIWHKSTESTYLYQHSTNMHPTHIRLLQHTSPKILCRILFGFLSTSENVSGTHAWLGPFTIWVLQNTLSCKCWTNLPLTELSCGRSGDHSQSIPLNLSKQRLFKIQNS